MTNVHQAWFALLIPVTVESVLSAQSIAADDPRLMIPSPLGVFSDSVQVDWVRNYISGFVPSFDIAYAIAVDSSENVYVTGESYGVNQLPDFATIKYNSSGDTLWVRRYNSPENNWDASHALAVDQSGNAYVTGVTYRSNTDFDYLTMKYNSSGVQQWAARYNGPGNGDDWPNDITVDKSGNVYVTGYSPGSGTFYDYATIKYDASGIQQWVARYNAPGNTKDQACALAVDGSGNVYVTGSSGEGSVNLSDYVTIKYSPSGVEQWVARYTSVYDYATGLAIDSAANVYVTGYSFSSGTYYDYATIKYNTAGVQQWVDRYDGTGHSDDLAYDLAIDASGNVYVTGESVGPGTSADFAIVKYNPSGNRQWVARYNGPGNAVDRGVALAIDTSGNIYVTGDSDGSGTEDDFATIKYSPSGIQQWVARYNGPGDTFDLSYGVAVGVSGSVCVTGYSAEIGRRLYTTIRYVQVPLSIPCEDITRFQARCGPEGLIQARVLLSDDSHTGDVIEFSVDGFPHDVVIEDRQALFSQTGFGPGLHTVELTDPADCFDPTTVNCRAGVSEDNRDLWDDEKNGEEPPAATTLLENYPNPFNPATEIMYRLTVVSDVSLVVYDFLGREIAALVNGRKGPGTYMVRWDATGYPSGVYFCRLQAGRYTETRRLLLLK